MGSVLLVKPVCGVYQRSSGGHKFRLDHMAVERPEKVQLLKTVPALLRIGGFKGSGYRC